MPESRRSALLTPGETTGYSIVDNRRMPTRCARPDPLRGPPSPSCVRRYRAGGTTPTEVVSASLDGSTRRGDDGVWISVVDRDELAGAGRGARAAVDPASAAALRRAVRRQGQHRRRRRAHHAGLPGLRLPCRRPPHPSSQRLLDGRGRCYVGKTNLDQFATGLNGTRTPYRRPASVYRRRPDLRRVELRARRSPSPPAQVPFAVATDTAGSGRVPAGAQRDRRLQAVPRADQHGRAGAGLPVAGLHQPDGRRPSRPRGRLRRRRRRRRPRDP